MTANRITDKQIDDLARPYCGLGGVENYRAFAMDILSLACVSQQAEPVYWEYRSKDTHPSTVTSGQWFDWQRVAPSGLQTMDQRLNEIREYIVLGYAMELRALYVAPPAPATGEAVKELVEVANQCRLELVVQVHELADHIERASVWIADHDMLKQINGQRKHSMQVADKWNQNGNPFAALAKHGPQAEMQWGYCPECGCEEWKKTGFDNGRYCSKCGQEWFPDVDYSKVVHTNLTTLHSKVSDLTAYGEKVREAAARVCECVADGRCHPLEFKYRLGCASSAEAIRSMPLPAQSEGEEK